MIEVKLISTPSRSAESLAQHAARTCYESELPGPGMRKRPAVKDQLFDKGHHTTLEHGNYTFSVEGCAIGDITFGFHYTTPYYNSDQRSGRYTTDMFNPVGLSRIGDYLREVYPEVSHAESRQVLNYVGRGINLFHVYMPEAIKAVAEAIRDERPKASEKYIKNSAKKFAQEQIRSSIPVIFPTAFYYSINIVTLASLYRAPWKPGMRIVLQKMVDLVLANNPRIAYMFEGMGTTDQYIVHDGVTLTGCRYSPQSEVIRVDESCGNPPPREDIHPIDLLPVKPEYLSLKTDILETSERMSVATMGQDQRHRSVNRGNAFFTGEVYVPPIARAIGMEEGLIDISREWYDLRECLDPALHENLAPYGAVIRYTKSSNFAAAIHDLAKRSCWQAQEEHYNKDRQVRIGIAELYPEHMLLEAMVPPCYGCKICGEGDRFCCRDMTTQDRGEDYFPVRRV